MRLDRLTPQSVRTWYSSLDASKPTRRAHAYGLLRAICMTAYREDLISANPCRIAGGGRVRKQHKTETATLAELDAIAQAIAPRYRSMVLLAGWCGLRHGELTELRRRDLDLERGSVKIERAVTRVDGVMVVGDPKSEAGKRTVAIPRDLLPVLANDVATYVPPSDDALLFPARKGGHLTMSTFHRVWDHARRAGGRPELPFHDLRHTGLTLAAATGATLADLMARAGHSTASAAMRYQHSVQDRDRAIADALADMAEAKVIPLRRRGTT
ncbi:MAG: putative integrase [Frankiales bacterium]|nr:putative integrase [Frankiales bacterium]